MRKLFFLLILGMSMIYGASQPALPVPRVVDRSITVTEAKIHRLDESEANNFSPYEFTVIDGEEITGSPFLYPGWENGSISTVNGRVVSKYMLRYDIYHQSVLFLNGRDSMEVSEEIKEFSLIFYNGKNLDSTRSFRFINSNQFKGNKNKNTNYYQLLYDDERGQLLKLNRKEIKTGDKDLANPLSPANTKKFVQENTYYFYDKSKGTFTRIKSNGSNIANILGLTPERKEELGMNGYDLSDETEMIDFFRNSLSKKAF